MLRLENLQVTYRGSIQAVRGVTLQVPPGGRVALLGNNGAGKTSVLRAISGVLHLWSGEFSGSIMANGMLLNNKTSDEIVRSGIVQVPSGRGILKGMTVKENLLLGLDLNASGKRVEDLKQVFSFFPILKDRLQQKAGYLSGGEQQMLALARAYLLRPLYLLCDEFSLGLAPKVVDFIFEILNEIIRARGTGVLIVEQNAYKALEFTEYAYVLENGRLATEGNARELREDPRLVTSFLGNLGSNVASGKKLSQETSLLEVKDLELNFGGVTALAGASMRVRQGEIHSLIGPNGAGKTSLVNCLCGFYQPQRGQVTYNGNDITGLKPNKASRLGIARVFQNIELLEQLTVEENVLLGRHNLMRYSIIQSLFDPFRTGKEERSHLMKVYELLTTLQLDSYRRVLVSELPLGVRKKVELARALAMEPQLLILDEPTMGMNEEEKGELMQLLVAINRTMSKTLLLIEHDLSIVMNVSDEITVLHLGRTIATGSPIEVYENPTVIEAYIGKSQVKRAG